MISRMAEAQRHKQELIRRIVEKNRAKIIEVYVVSDEHLHVRFWHEVTKSVI